MDSNRLKLIGSSMAISLCYCPYIYINVYVCMVAHFPRLVG